jgi:pyruvate dehydrogenase E1 component alpha subunit
MKQNNNSNKRSATFNVSEKSFQNCTNDISLLIIEKMYLVQEFERQLIESISKGLITYPVYLSTGQESLAAATSLIINNFQVFAQHRAHDIYLCFGGDQAMLRDELLGLPTGTSKGKAGSNCLQCHSKSLKMYGHHGLIGENVPMGVGAALANNKNTLCIFGDGSAEEDYVLSSLGFAATHKLPVLFICLDNDLSILTPTDTRRKWEITDVAKSMNIPTVDISDDPWEILHQTENLTQELPALINCRTCRKYWHVGTGNDGEPEWDRYKLCKDKLNMIGLENEITEIERRIAKSMEDLWNLN